MNRCLLSVLAISLVTLLHIDPAAAQNQRSWVSGTGNDSFPCARTTPCLTFAGAIAKTNPGGEINCLDSGDFGTAVIIDKSISIRCVGVTAGVQFGFAITAPAGSEVLLEGLDIDGLGLGPTGVRILSATKVTIQRCSIRNFAGNGVDLAGPLGARVLIAD